eukprot:4634372-Amphidinium_carterae.2
MQGMSKRMAMRVRDTLSADTSRVHSPLLVLSVVFDKRYKLSHDMLNGLDWSSSGRLTLVAESDSDVQRNGAYKCKADRLRGQVGVHDMGFQSLPRRWKNTSAESHVSFIVWIPQRLGPSSNSISEHVQFVAD